jgi:hypothetical protein
MLGVNPYRCLFRLNELQLYHSSCLAFIKFSQCFVADSDTALVHFHHVKVDSVVGVSELRAADSIFRVKVNRTSRFIVQQTHGIRDGGFKTSLSLLVRTRGASSKRPLLQSVGPQICIHSLIL